MQCRESNDRNRERITKHHHEVSNKKRVFTLDDWGIPEKRPEIIEYEYTVGDKEPVKFEGTPQAYPDKSIQIHMEDESCARSVMTGLTTSASPKNCSSASPPFLGSSMPTYNRNSTPPTSRSTSIVHGPCSSALRRATSATTSARLSVLRAGPAQFLDRPE